MPSNLYKKKTPPMVGAPVPKKKTNKNPVKKKDGLGKNGTMYIGANGELWTFESFVENPPISNPKVYLMELKIMNQVSAQGHGLDKPEPVELSSD